MIRFKTYSAIRPVSREVIEDVLRDTGGREVIFVAPEYAKAQVEREVLAYKESGSANRASVDTGDNVLTLSSSMISGDVLSFRRLAGSILDELGVNYVAEGGEIVLRNAIYNILVYNRDKLQAFAALSSRIDYINMMIALLGDFSRYGVGIDDIDKAIESLEKSKASPTFIYKLKDLHLIMTELEEMNVKYSLNLLREPIALACERLASYKDDGRSGRRCSGLAAVLRSKIVFVGFGATRMLTPKEIKLVSLLSELGSDIEFNVLTGAGESDFSSVYKVGKDFAAMLEGIGASGSELDLQNEDNELISVIRSYASDVKPEVPDTKGRVRLAELAGIDDRIGYIFNEIIDLTRNQGYRYRDIRIVCCNEDIIPRMRSTAEIYGLDVFIDRKIALDGTVVPYMMRLLLELPESHYSLDNVMKAMRCGMLRIPPHIADAFENYCYAKNITDGGRLFDENVYAEPDCYNERYVSITGVPDPGNKGDMVKCGKYFYENVVVRELIPLKNSCEAIKGAGTLKGKAEKSLDYFKCKREYIELLKQELIARGDNAAAVALVRGYDELINLLMCQAHEMNECDIKQKDFLSMIRTDMRNRTEGTIPLKVDSIEITTPEHAFVTPCKVLFLIGAQKDNFPYVRMREGLLSGIELKTLSASNEDISLPDKAESKMREEFVTACLTLGSAIDRLYLVHEYGKQKSHVFDYLERVTDAQYHIVNTFRNPVAGERVKFRHDYENARIPADVMDRLLTTKKKDGTRGKVIYASVSSIEDYRECAFKYMMERRLAIRKRDDNTSIRSNSFGTLVHSMFETAYRTLRDESGKDPARFNSLAEELLSDEAKYDAFADKCLKESVISRASFGSVDKEGNPTDPVFEMDTYAKLRRMFRMMFRDVLNDSVSTGFVPEGIEEKIGDDNMSLNIPYDGIDLHFNGYIDRYDIKLDEDGFVHVRTLDYKSGDKKISTTELLNGTQIQLPVYSGAVLDKSSQDGQEAVLDDYGYILIGLDPVDKGKQLQCAPDLSGYSPESVKIAVDYSRHIVKESIDQIASGKADAVTATPKLDSCKYCQFKGYCGNNPSSSAGRARIDTEAESSKLRNDDEYAGLISEMESYAMRKSEQNAILTMKAKLLDEKNDKANGKEA